MDCGKLSGANDCTTVPFIFTGAFWVIYIISLIKTYFHVTLLTCHCQPCLLWRRWLLNRPITIVAASARYVVTVQGRWRCRVSDGLRLWHSYGVDFPLKQKSPVRMSVVTHRAILNALLATVNSGETNLVKITGSYQRRVLFLLSWWARQ